MNDFLRFFDSTRQIHLMHLEIYYSKTLDWCIKVWKKGCAKNGADLEILNISNCDMEDAFVLAHVELKDWISKGNNRISDGKWDIREGELHAR